MVSAQTAIPEVVCFIPSEYACVISTILCIQKYLNIFSYFTNFVKDGATLYLVADSLLLLVCSVVYTVSI